MRKQAVHKKGIPKNYEAKDKVDIVEKVTRIEKKKSSKDVTFIIKTLRSHFVFYALSDSDLYLSNLSLLLILIQQGEHR